MVWFMIIYAAVVLLIGLIIVKIKTVEREADAASRRECPICGSRLKEEERLFADELTKKNGPSELRIKGCSHCYEK